MRQGAGAFSVARARMSASPVFSGSSTSREGVLASVPPPCIRAVATYATGHKALTDA